MQTRWDVALIVLSFHLTSSVLALYFPCTTSLSSNGICTSVDECLIEGVKGFDCPHNLICCPKISRSKEIRLRQDQSCHNQFIDTSEDGPVQRNQFPWMVLLRYHDTIKKRYFYGCIGSLISSSLVLTSAHCITGLEIGTKLTSVRMGVRDLNVDCPFNATKSSKACSEIQDFLITHAWYPNEGDFVFTKDGTHSKHDIGLLVIKKMVKYTNEVTPVCLLNVPVKLDKAKLVVAGWKGDLADQVGQTGNVLQQRAVKVMNSSLCGKAFDAEFNDENQLCVGEEIDDDQSCSDLGDSGLVLHLIRNGKIFVHAISSYGQENCQDGVKLRVFTVIQPYIELMQETSKELGVHDFPMTIIEIF